MCYFCHGLSIQNGVYIWQISIKAAWHSSEKLAEKPKIEEQQENTDTIKKFSQPVFPASFTQLLSFILISLAI